MKVASPYRSSKNPVLGWWLSFADTTKGKFIGIAIVKGCDQNWAVARCVELGIFPDVKNGLDIDFTPVDLQAYDPADLDRMLSREDAERLGDRVIVRRGRGVPNRKQA